MVPRPIGSGAPQCARCGKTVYMAEQVVGPYSKPYHKPCLTCVVCNKRLDSTLLLEHDGEPYCKSCHKTHLGQGRGGFGLSVPLRPEKPIALQSSPKPSNGTGYKSEAARRVEERLAEEMSGINLSPRRDNPSPTLRQPASPSTYQPRTHITTLSKPTTVAQSIDHLVSSGVEVPIPYSRKETEGEVYGNYGQQDRYAQNDGRELREYEEDNYAKPITTEYTREESRPYERSESPNRKQPLTPPRITAQDTIGEAGDGLPTPRRKDPIALARERERGVYSTGTGTVAKTYSPRTTPLLSPGGNGSGNGNADQNGYSPNSQLAKMGLGSTVNAAAIGTPLCARCQRPVYFAEQKQAASRKWHRFCLRCDGCNTTLESGKLEEGPLSATYEFPTNVWCRTCYAKRFGPKGIGVAGMSLPENAK
jgi:LIM domain